jgi:hypothetical protein
MPDGTVVWLEPIRFYVSPLGAVTTLFAKG